MLQIGGRADVMGLGAKVKPGGVEEVTVRRDRRRKKGDGERKGEVEQREEGEVTYLMKLSRVRYHLSSPSSFLGTMY